MLWPKRQGQANAPRKGDPPPEKLELRIIINIMRINQLLPIRMTAMRVP